jgi:hypothetical protein
MQKNEVNNAKYNDVLYKGHRIQQEEKEEEIASKATLNVMEVSPFPRIGDIGEISLGDLQNKGNSLLGFKDYAQTIITPVPGVGVNNAIQVIVRFKLMLKSEKEAELEKDKKALFAISSQYEAIDQQSSNKIISMTQKMSAGKKQASILATLTEDGKAVLKKLIKTPYGTNKINWNQVVSVVIDSVPSPYGPPQTFVYADVMIDTKKFLHAVFSGTGEKSMCPHTGKKWDELKFMTYEVSVHNQVMNDLMLTIIAYDSRKTKALNQKYNQMILPE